MPRLPERVRRFWGGDTSTPESVSLIDVARALLSEDDRAAERVAAQLARDRQLAERKAADRAEADAAKRRQASVAKWIADECRRQGFWWPSDYT